MKRYIFFMLILFLMSGILSGCELNENIQKSGSLELEELNYEEIKDKLVRFHVIANSDTDEDQALKLKVRDKVIDELSNKLIDTKTIEEAKAILSENIDFVTEVAQKVISESGYEYNVKTMLSHENFPDKVYGDYIFPQGDYEAFRVIIGSGQGQNWWCVMFPPLCFIDETKNSVDSKDLKENIKDITSEKNTDTNNKESKAKKDIVFKSKVVELISDLFD